MTLPLQHVSWKAGRGRVVRIREKEHTLWHGSFLSETVYDVLVALGRSVKSLVLPASVRPLPATVQPKGMQRLVLDADGTSRCIACSYCASVCPAHCMHIITAQPADSDVMPHPAEFIIDKMRCIECGCCVAACPVQALAMDGKKEQVAFESRRAGVFRKIDLLEL